MTYELCKQLKDAGFPQKDLGKCGEKHEHNQRDCVYPYTPTLSELISACGERFGYLQQKERKGKIIWCANSDGTHEDIEAPTPEEAVARLWLELNKK